MLNTSFIENEPIVDMPQQAVDCFVRTDMRDIVFRDACVARLMMQKLMPWIQPTG